MNAMRIVALTGPLAGCALFAAVLGSEAARAQTLLVYQPPDRDAPPARVSGGTRSIGGPQIALRVLAPEHPGLTISEQPTLYWFLSSGVDRPAIVSLVDDDAVDPILELRLEPPFAAGIQSIALADHDIRLDPNKAYHWGVTLESDSEDPFKDTYAGGAIERIMASDSLKAALDASLESQRAVVLAQSGVWYDAIDALSSAIAHAPGERRFRDLRRRLLEQVGLPKVAVVDEVR